MLLCMGYEVTYVFASKQLIKVLPCIFISFIQPSNMLLDADCFVKLCDFGLARSLYQMQEDAGNPALTEYVATRWYRAPEILLGSARYLSKKCVTS